MLRSILLAAALGLAASPAHAAHWAVGAWECAGADGVGVGWVELAEGSYRTRDLMGTFDGGSLAIQEAADPAPVVVLSGPLVATYGALGGVKRDGALTFIGVDGPVLTCHPSGAMPVGP